MIRDKSIIRYRVKKDFFYLSQIDKDCGLFVFFCYTRYALHPQIIQAEVNLMFPATAVGMHWQCPHLFCSLSWHTVGLFNKMLYSFGVSGHQNGDWRIL